MKSVFAPLLAVLLFAACDGDRVAGTSSGVDNPALTVAFVDAGGTAMRINGELDVYGADQNPAVDAEPLVAIKVSNSAFTNLTGADFARLREAAAKAAARTAETGASKSAKLAAGAGADAIASSPDSAATPFNLILKTQDRNGSLVMGFKYDSRSKAFSLSGGALNRVDVRPKPLVRYQANVAGDAVNGDAGRVFLPGTPYLAALVNGAFVLEDLPAGVFPIHLLAADGKVYPMIDSLNTQIPSPLLHPSPHPVGSVDTTVGDTSSFSVMAGPDHEAFLELPSYLEAKVIGVDPLDPRLTVRWKLIDTVDTASAKPAKDTVLVQRRADITLPTALRSEVKFSAEGVYTFQIAAAFGARSRYDTLIVSVRRVPSPTKARIIQPRSGDSVFAEKPYTIQWEMPDSGKGLVTIRFSSDGGGKWINLSSHYGGKDSVSIFPWTPSKALGVSTQCKIEVVSETDSIFRARMDGTFNLLQ